MAQPGKRLDLPVQAAPSSPLLTDSASIAVGFWAKSSPWVCALLSDHLHLRGFFFFLFFFVYGRNVAEGEGEAGEHLVAKYFLQGVYIHGYSPCVGMRGEEWKMRSLYCCWVTSTDVLADSLSCSAWLLHFCLLPATVMIWQAHWKTWASFLFICQLTVSSDFVRGGGCRENRDVWGGGTQ